MEHRGKRRKSEGKRASTAKKIRSASSASLHKVNIEEYELELLVEKRPVEESVGYAVFEKLYNEEKYLIYKICIQPKEKEWKRFAAVQPIYIADHTDFATPSFPRSMTVFSVGSRIYFVGGYYSNRPGRNHLTGAYMFDTNSPNQRITPIQSMSYPKPDSHVIGPLHNDKVYIFSDPYPYGRESSCYCSFEMLDTRLNQWKWIPLQKPFSCSLSPFNPNSTTSALCVSNIVISNSVLHALHIYSTTTRTWREVNFDPNPKNNLSFCRKGHYLFETKRCYFILANKHSADVPSVYSCPKAKGVFNTDGVFKCLGEIEIESVMPKMRPYIDSLVSITTNPPDPTKKNTMYNRTCIFTHEDPHNNRFQESNWLAIKICDLSLQEEEEWSLVKFEAKSILQYSIRSRNGLKAHHFFVV